MKQLIMIGVAALLLGCTSVKKDEFVIKGHIGSYPKDILTSSLKKCSFYN